MLNITFCGAARTVTGSQYYLEYKDPNFEQFNFCIDSGLFQVGQKVNLFKINSHLVFDPKKLDAIVLTHAHLDHCGRIPYLVKRGFGGRIYSTPATKQIAEVVMLDAAKIQTDESNQPDYYFPVKGLRKVELIDESDKFEVNKMGDKILDTGLLNKENTGLYAQYEVEETMTRFVTFDYHHKYLIHPNLQVEFFDAGHILGSAYCVITELSTGKQVVFSGDLGNIDKPIIEDPELISDVPGVTHIFIETTYGNRMHGKQDPKERLRSLCLDVFGSSRTHKKINKSQEYLIHQELEKNLKASEYAEIAATPKTNLKLKNQAKEVDKQAYETGKLLVPSFSVERAQELIYLLVELMRDGQIPRVPIFLDSPMASKVLQICLDHPELYDEKLRQKISEKANPLIYKSLKILDTSAQSKILNTFEESCIIIAGSGMLNGGRIVKHLQFHIENPNNILLIIGYQAEGTLGRQILEGAKEIKVDTQTYQVKAQIQVINEFSAHADQKMLKLWVQGLILGSKHVPTVFLMHGEKESSTTFGKELDNTFGNRVNTYWPHFGEKLQLWE